MRMRVSCSGRKRSWKKLEEEVIEFVMSDTSIYSETVYVLNIRSSGR